VASSVEDMLAFGIDVEQSKRLWRDVEEQ